MIDNFDNVKKQLRELATVINEFKSESVQLRVVELLFERMEIGVQENDEKKKTDDTPKKRMLAGRGRTKATS